MGVRLSARRISRASLVALFVLGSIGAHTVFAEPPKKGLLYVVTTPASASCEIDSAIRGMSPLVAQVGEGDHAITCRATIEGVAVGRSAKAVVSAGKGTKLVVELGLSASVEKPKAADKSQIGGP